jgi:penicillin-binding protein 1A
MAGQNGGNGRLVADRRYGAKRPAPKPAPKARPPKKPKRSRRARGGNIFTRLIFGLIGLVWTMTWRVGLVAALGLGGDHLLLLFAAAAL